MDHQSSERPAAKYVTLDLTLASRWCHILCFGMKSDFHGYQERLPVFCLCSKDQGDQETLSLEGSIL